MGARVPVSTGLVGQQSARATRNRKSPCSSWTASGVLSSATVASTAEAGMASGVRASGQNAVPRTWRRSKGRCAPGTNALSFSASARHVYDYLAANASTVQYEYRTSNRRAPYEYCSRILLRTGFRTKRGMAPSISPVTSSFSSYSCGIYSCNYKLYLHISTTRLRVGD